MPSTRGWEDEAGSPGICRGKFGGQLETPNSPHQMYDSCGCADAEWASGRVFGRPKANGSARFSGAPGRSVVGRGRAKARRTGTSHEDLDAAVARPEHAGESAPRSEGALVQRRLLPSAAASCTSLAPPRAPNSPPNAVELDTRRDALGGKALQA